MKSKKALITLCITLIMAFSLGITANAASSKTIAKIGSKNYSSLEKAIKSVKKGQTIKLMKNVTVNGELNFNKSVKFTVNLNKKNIKPQNNSRDYFRISKGNITFKNGTIKAPNIAIKGKSNVTFQNVRYVASYKGGSPEIHIWQSAKATFKKCTMPETRFEAWDKSILTVDNGKYGDVWNYSSKTATIKNGIFQKIYNASKGKTLIQNGTIKTTASDGAYRVGVTRGSMVIKKMNLVAGRAGITVNKEASLRIDGGKFETKEKYGGTVLNNQGKTTINGGTFSTATTATINDGICTSGTLKMSPKVRLINCKIQYFQ